MSHCGSSGLQEALIAGVPIVGFPVFGDEINYAARIVRKGFRLKLNLRSFSKMANSLIFLIKISQEVKQM